jgi:N-acetylglucosaminyldiphosphoundecaprenol N-acetyl-beta-D-mannosaminyltransferase
MRKVRILNAAFDDITMEELLGSFREGMLLTMHVDMIMKLQKDREFHGMIPLFDVVTCDSRILFAAAKVLGTPLRECVSGSRFFPRYYMRHKDDPDVTIFICGGGPGVAELAQGRINAKVGRTMVVGTYSPPFDYDTRPGEIERMLAQINASRASVLVMGISAGKQEKFIVGHRDRMPHVRTFLPLGGTVDYEAGTLRPPASWITDAGLEWLYRLLREPRQRWRRYLVHQPPVLYQLARQRLGLYRDPFATTAATPAFEGSSNGRAVGPESRGDGQVSLRPEGS